MKGQLHLQKAVQIHHRHPITFTLITSFTMHFANVLALATVAMAAPSSDPQGAPLIAHSDNNGRYIVKLKDSSDVGSLNSVVGLLDSEPDNIYSNVMNGFSAAMDEQTLQRVRMHPDVEYIEESAILRLEVEEQGQRGQHDPSADVQMSSNSEWVNQEKAIWGLSRVSSKKPGKDTYSYEKTAGEGVCVYVIDTGIDDKHPDFEGRAMQVKSWVSGEEKDGHGHGTHCAGTTSSNTYGVAKKSTVYGFKVLADNGSGSIDGIISAIDEVVSDSGKRKCPKGVAVNMSFGGEGAHQGLSDACVGLIKKGIFVGASAGNSNKDAAGFTPAGTPEICTIGATDNKDAKSDFSNHGKIVDLQAPGSLILSTFPGNGTKEWSGTSMAAPHAVGLAATYMALGIKGDKACDHMKETANKGVITGVPSGTTPDLIFNANPKAE